MYLTNNVLPCRLKAEMKSVIQECVAPGALVLLRLACVCSLWSLIARSSQTAWSRVTSLRHALFPATATVAATHVQHTNTAGATHSSGPTRGIGLDGLLDGSFQVSTTHKRH